MVQEKKNMLRVWNVILVAGAFALSLFGTFLTSSGVISSIHSFTQSSIGPFFLGFIAVVAAFSIALDPLPAPAPALADAARVARLARGRLPLQQPLPRRARAHDPLGRRLPAGLRGGARCRRLGGRAVLRLLRGRLRPAARAAHGHRAGGRLAARFASVARLAARPAGGRRARRPARCSCSPARARARPASSATRSPPSC